MSTLHLDHISYTYEKTETPVLRDITADFEAGKMYAIIGKSGAGKTTLLSLISGLDVCGQGTIFYNGEDLKSINRDRYRALNIGVVFQGYNLLLNASAVENVVLSMNLSGDRSAGKKLAAYGLLEKVGIDRITADRKILKLSGGEQQRTGIARALSHNPDILIADEPTGNLDESTEEEIMQILTGLVKNEKRCVIIVTHSHKVASYADEVLGLSGGRLITVNQRSGSTGN
ncbi:MAG: ABC transporter ATP-binding protein [Acetatifactor sp.]|nr:ABC transporter ATP-binding protein [Acetatifactor sp.]